MADFIVCRLRFDAHGHVFKESTFATEEEIGGLFEQQLLLGIGPGALPTPTAGPLFAQPQKGHPDDNDHQD